jgi:hypothetical protein
VINNAVELMRRPDERFPTFGKGRLLRPQTTEGRRCEAGAVALNFGTLHFLTPHKVSVRESRTQLCVWTDLGENSYLLPEMISAIYFAVVAERVAAKPSPFNNQRYAEPGNSKTSGSVAWKGVPPPSSIDRN